MQRRAHRPGHWLALAALHAATLGGCGGGQQAPASAAAPISAPAPPVAERIPHEVQVNGQVLSDPYAWLRQRESPKVLAYLQAENAYTDLMMRGVAALQDTLYAEMKGRLVDTDTSAPVYHGPYQYYRRLELGKSYPIHLRRKQADGAQEEVVLDENVLAAGLEFFDLGAFEVSPNHARVAYATDVVGDEHYTLSVKDLASGVLGPEHIPDVAPSFVWADDATLFYLTLDGTNRPYKVFRHRLGEPAHSDVEVFSEPDVAYYAELERSRSGQYVFLELNSAVTSEVHFLPTKSPQQPFTLIAARRNGVEYRVADHGQQLFIATNADGAQSFKLMVSSMAAPGAEHWQPLTPYRPEVTITGIDAFREHLVVYEREGGLPQVRVRETAAPFREHRVAFPEPVYDVGPGDNLEYDTTRLRLDYTSLVTPRSAIDYDLSRRTQTLVKRAEVRGGYDPGQYETRRVFAPGEGGVKVPISLVFKRGALDRGPCPLLLQGYGAYGINYDPRFDMPALSLLSRGFVVAIAHVRGGAELGRAWYEDGKLRKKKNTFTDFIAAAEQLIADGYTTPQKLAISGASAGGLLIGAVSNMRPELFRAVVADVPFVDLMNTMLDASLPLTVTEWEEWGDPRKPDDFAYMRAYSPYDNVAAQAYPDFLILGGLNDRRVAYWEPAKWAAQLRFTKTDDHLLLLRTYMGAGHSGVSGRYERLKEKAFEYAFLLGRLAVE